MKKISVFQIVVILSIIILFAIEFFTRCNNNFDSNSVMKESDISTIKNSKIAVVKIDTLLKYYTMAIEVKQIVEQKKNTLLEKFQAKQNLLIQQYNEFQKSQSTLSKFEISLKETELSRKKQELVKLEQDLSSQLIEFEQKHLNTLNKEIQKSLNEYLTDKPYDVVIADKQNINVLWSRSGIDITTEIIYLLNEEYKIKKGVKDAPPTP